MGLICAALGFVAISFSSSRTVNGVVTDCSYFDLSPWVFGPIALVAGAKAVVAARRAGSAANRDLVLGAVAVVVGLVHLLRAGGVVDLLSSSPC